MKNLKPYLQKMIDDIDAGNSNIEEDDAIEIARFVKEIARKDMPMSKYEACVYLNISRSKFDGHVREGKIPKGKKMPGWKELAWFKKDLKKLKK